MDDRSKRPASRGMRKRGFLILTSAFAAVARAGDAAPSGRPQSSERPPSTNSVWPVVIADASDARWR